jgi:hypothetical protein
VYELFESRSVFLEDPCSDLVRNLLPVASDVRFRGSIRKVAFVLSVSVQLRTQSRLLAPLVSGRVHLVELPFERCVVTIEMGPTVSIPAVSSWKHSLRSKLVDEVEQFARVRYRSEKVSILRVVVGELLEEFLKESLLDYVIFDNSR